MDYDNDYDFPHDNLDAWTIARRARTEVRRLMASLPRGYGDDKEQVRRASGSVVRNICEGAARRGDGEKRQHFNYANAEAAETAGTVQTWVDDRVVDINAGYGVIRLYGRVGAMMHGLIRKHGVSRLTPVGGGRQPVGETVLPWRATVSSPLRKPHDQNSRDYVDVDYTFVRSFGSKRNVISSTLDRIRELHAEARRCTAGALAAANMRRRLPRSSATLSASSGACRNPT